MSEQATWRIPPNQLIAVVFIGGALALSCGGPKTPCGQATAHVSECTGSIIELPASATDEQCLAVAATPCTDRRIMDLVGGAVGQALCGGFGIDCGGTCSGDPKPCSAFGGCPDGCFPIENAEGWMECRGLRPPCSSYNDNKVYCEENGCKWTPEPGTKQDKERCTTAAGDEQACPVDTNGSSSGGTDSKGYCGDKSCRPEEKEDCTSCVADCGYCLACGDRSCNYFPEPGETIENCSNCPQDCGPCPVCGDGSCWENREGTDGETCASCPQDCCPSDSNGSSQSSSESMDW